VEQGSIGIFGGRDCHRGGDLLAQSWTYKHCTGITPFSLIGRQWDLIPHRSIDLVTNWYGPVNRVRPRLCPRPHGGPFDARRCLFGALFSG
jgi:hypothetical protein